LVSANPFEFAPAKQGATHRAFKLANISRPGLAPEKVHRLFLYRRQSNPKLNTMAIEETTRAVRGSFPWGKQVEFTSDSAKFFA
jgi:hypothetical protein